MGMCMMFAIYATFCLTFRNWFPTFSVISGYQNKQEASLMLSLMAVCQLICRLIFLIVQTETPSLLRKCSRAMLFYGLVLFFLYFFKLQLLLVFSSVLMYSIMICQYLPYLFALPAFFGKTLTSNNSSRMMSFYALGESVLTFFVGYLMEYIHPMTMFLYMMLLAIIMNFLL